MPVHSTEAVLELEYDAVLGEGPVWDEVEAKLYWVDILSGQLFKYDPWTKTNTVYTIGEHVGAICLREGGGLVLVTQSGFAFYDFEEQSLTGIADPESHLSGNRFNDGKCDPAGRFWAGTLSYDLDEGSGNLYSLGRDMNVHIKLQNLTIPNGMAWNDNQEKFYFIDTFTRTIQSFDYNEESGDIMNPSVLKVIHEKEGYPDGMTIDEEGALWVALYGGKKVIRVDPSSGKTLFEVHLPVPKITSCTFGGAALDELYITTAREHMTEQDIDRAPLSGSLFKANVPFTGRPTYRFAGSP